MQMSAHLMKAIKVLFTYYWNYLCGHYTGIMSANEAFLKYNKYPLLLEGGVLAFTLVNLDRNTGFMFTR